MLLSTHVIVMMTQVHVAVFSWEWLNKKQNLFDVKLSNELGHDGLEACFDLITLKFYLVW